MEKQVTECNRCGKRVIHTESRTSIDMVLVRDTCLFFCDKKETELCRPSLFSYPEEYASHTDPFHFCLDCFLAEVTEWVDKMKKRGPSEIPAENIIEGVKKRKR